MNRFVKINLPLIFFFSIITPALALEESTLVKMVEDLMSVRKTLQPILPLSEKYGAFTVEEAYRVQGALIKRISETGAKVIGYKVAYSSKASQETWKVPEPAFGRLFDYMQVPNGGEIELDDYITFHIEVEVAMTVGKEINKPIKDVEELKSYIKGVHPAFESPEVRFRDVEKMKAVDLIADSVGSHRFVIGEEKDPEAVDIDKIVVTLYFNDQEVRRVPTTDVLGSPWNAMLWIANALISRQIALKPGDIVITGSIGKAFFGPDDGKPVGKYRGDFGPLGEVTCTVR